MGMAESMNCGNNGAPLVGNMLGTAFQTVKTVSDNIDQVNYLAANMDAIDLVAQKYEQIGDSTDVLTTIASVMRSVDGLDVTPLAAATDRKNKLLGFDGAGATSVYAYSDLSAALQTQADALTKGAVVVVDNYILPGETDHTAAFNRAFAVSNRVHGKNGAIYTVKDINLAGKQFIGNGCVIRDAVGARYCFRLSGWNPVLRDVQFQDQGYVTKACTNLGGFVAGATVIPVSSTTGLEVGQMVLVQGNGNYWNTTRISAIGANTITLYDGVTDSGTSGMQVIASWGLVHISDSSFAWVNDILMNNAGVGMLVSPQTSTCATATIQRFQVSSSRYCAFAKYGDTWNLKLTDASLTCGVTDGATYTADGTSGPYGFQNICDLTRDISVYVNGVLKVYGVDYTLNNSFSIIFLAGKAPAAGASIIVYNYHAGIRGFVEDQRHTVVAGGNMYAQVQVLKTIIAFELQSVSLCYFTQCFADTNFYIGLYVNNCGLDLIFNQFTSTWARQPIVVFNSAWTQFIGLLTNMPPTNQINPALPNGTVEIQVDPLSTIEIDLPSWSSKTYTVTSIQDANLLGSQNISFCAESPITAGQSSYLSPMGKTTAAIPLQIMERNCFIVGFYLALAGFSPGTGNTVTINVYKNANTTPALVVAMTIADSGFGGFIPFTPFTLAAGESLHVQLVYSASAQSSTPRGFFIKR